MTQKDIFLKSEGDAWFRRNCTALASRDYFESDPLLHEFQNLPDLMQGTRVLEIGCADGRRLKWLKDNRAFECYGIEPSAQAIQVARDNGIEAIQGTAEHLPFDDRYFDVVVFGFCLYLCDREHLFRIACEADRVLKNPGWLLILDFYSPTPMRREYHHLSGLFSHKMDYRTLFTWNPGYSSFSHRVCHHSNKSYTDDTSEWIATSVLRKNLQGNE
jgi:ubiquinone/menaquinone biosynthesis C-methylase UbiE